MLSCRLLTSRVCKSYGAAQLELAIVLGLFIIIAVPVLLNVLFPGFIRTNDDERLVAGFESASVAARSIQELTLEGLQLKGDATSEVTLAANTLLNLTGSTGICATALVSYVDSGGTAHTDFGENSDGIASCVTQFTDIPATAISDFESSLDPLQSGIQSSIIVFRPASPDRHLRERALTATTNGF